jgi:hypothetical protein
MAGDGCQQGEQDRMSSPKYPWHHLAFTLAAILTLVAGTRGREHAKEPPFKFVGGTEALPVGCKGELELLAQHIVFRCPLGSVTIPYQSVHMMEYRSNLSKDLRRMKIKWKVRPEIVGPLFGKKENRYFTIVYGQPRPTEALVLKVSPDDMRPYLAEIDLKTGHRVEVMGYEKYD